MRVRALLVAGALAASVVTFVGIDAGTIAPAGATPVVNPVVDPMDKASVLAAYEASLEEARNVPVGWTGNAASCTKGANSAASQDATLSAVNFYRALNRLDPVTFTAAGNSKALAAALMFQANNAISHTPPTTWNCYTAEAAQGAGGSNIAQGAVAARAVDAYIADPGSGNYFAGHRRSILYPPAQTMGTGSATGYSALWASDPAGPRPVNMEWIAWPSEGFVPKDIVSSRFSLSSNLYPNANYSAASITVKVGSTSLPVTKYSMVGGYGDNTLTWDVTLPADFQATDGDVRFDISVSGIKKFDGTVLPARTYSSTAATGTTTAPTPPLDVRAQRGSGGSALVSWDSPTSDGGSPITGYVVTPYIGTTAQAHRTFADDTRLVHFIDGLTNGTTYTFRVRAMTASGISTESAPSPAVTVADEPGPPTNITGVPGDGQVTVSWTAPTSTGGLPITGYKLVAFVDGLAKKTITTTGPGTSAVVTGLTNGTPYTFRMNSINAAGTGSLSQMSAAVTPNPPPVIPYAPFGSWGAFVDRQFKDVTTKTPTSAQRTSWVNQLTAGTKTKGDLVDALRRGSENLANVDPVVRVYRAFLGRAPDAGGLQFWIKRKRNVAPAKTWSVTQIATEFTNSNEFKTKYGSLTNRQFVTQIYTDVLGRAADPSGVNYWTGKLDRKEKTKAQVVVGFSESNEYKRKQLENTDVAVASIYLLGRAPTTAEATDWVTRQKAGISHAVLLTELLNSATYATRITG